MSDPNVAEFPVKARGKKFEDFEVGQVLDHHWGRTLTEADNAVFATTTHAYTPIYFNKPFAQAHGHRDTVVHPMLVLCTIVGLSVEDLSEGGGPFLGVNDIVYHAPVYPGDTLTARSTVTSKRESGSKKGVGIVSWKTEGLNQGGELVVSYERTNLSFMRDAG